MNASSENSNREISFTVKREFNTPGQLLWDAWTQPDLLDEWWEHDAIVETVDPPSQQITVHASPESDCKFVITFELLAR